MSYVDIGDTTLFYKTNSSKYITTFLNDYPTVIEHYLEEIYEQIIPMYGEKNLLYDNRCGENSDYVCKNLKLDKITQPEPEINTSNILNMILDLFTQRTIVTHKIGKIIIANWIETSNTILNQIESVYGQTHASIGASYHALPYMEIVINGETYFIAIETTIDKTYDLQFYVGLENDFKTIIHTRYQCAKYYVSFDCDKEWWAIAHGGASKKYYLKEI